jgi:MbtH protein
VYRIVVNDEEQYSIWPADRDLPGGWSAVGEPAGKQACLARIDELWTDMRPRSVREFHQLRGA